MDSLKYIFILALVVTEVAICAQDGVCGCGENDCEVVKVTEDEVTLKCEANNRGRADTGSKWPPGEESVANFSIDGVVIGNETTFENVTNSEAYSESLLQEHLISVGNATEERYPENYELRTSRVANDRKHGLRNRNLGESCAKTNTSSWPNITKINVNIFENCSLFNLFCFPKVKTVIVGSSNVSVLNWCGAHNVTDLSITSASIMELLSFQVLTNLKHLNLSKNSIKEIPVAELPPSIESLDVSYNLIIFYSNMTFPQTLRVLNVSHNKVTSVSNVILKGNVIILDLRSNGLTNVPVFEMLTLEELYLSENNISKLKEGQLTNLTSLTILDLKRNRLISLEERVFQGLYRLQSLYLSENNIVSLAPATFQYLNNLVVLSLSGNNDLGNEQEVEDASFLFGTGQRIQIIEASKTNLSRIPSTLSRSVRKLFLADNKISSIQCGELDSFPLLQILDMSINLISDIEEDALGRLDFLSHLIMFNNKISTVPKSLPDQLQVLDIRCNFIKKLHNNDFLGLQKLRVLLLSMNNITVIEDGAFGQLSSLEILDLSHNPIKTLSRTSFIGPRRLKEMYLISLKDLIPLRESLSFPAPESAHLEVLNIEASPALASQLMDDIAALTMFHELYELNLNYCRLSNLRSDLPKYLPRLHKLELTGNVLNCTNIFWLVKWLQALNISIQDNGKFRQKIYVSKSKCCEEAEDAKVSGEASVTCASPEYLSGKQIISLKEEDFPDLKVTTPAITPIKQNSITEPYVFQSYVAPTRNTPSNITEAYPTVTDSVSAETSTVPFIKSTVSQKESINIHQNPRNSFNVEKLHTKNFKLLKEHNERTKSINKETKRWRYLKSEPKYKLSYPDPVVVLLNGTDSIVSDFDNHVNESITSGAYLGHEHPPSSHPGMVVFLFVVGVIFAASSVMMYSQCSQSRRGRQYHPQQDIEVSSLGGNDLW